jgi:hypothetical protein
MGRLTAAAAVVLALAAGGCEIRDEDKPVDPRTPAAQRAVERAREVVAGALVDVRRDSDNGKWEVTVRQDGHDYEVELAARDMSLLRIDYD